MSIKSGWGNYPISNCNTFLASNINKIKHILLQNKKLYHMEMEEVMGTAH